MDIIIKGETFRKSSFSPTEDTVLAFLLVIL